jgi:hypothetical protein
MTRESRQFRCSAEDARLCQVQKSLPKSDVVVHGIVRHA